MVFLSESTGKEDHDALAKCGKFDKYFPLRPDLTQSASIYQTTFPEPGWAALSQTGSRQSVWPYQGQLLCNIIIILYTLAC